MPDNIILIGFMGAGKDAVGREIADRTGRAFLSTDECIERSTGRSIKDIFRIHGECYFRDIEAKTVKVIQGLHNTVIATGGGAVIREENRRWLKNAGTVLHLDASPSVLFARAGYDDKRPLAKRKRKFNALYRKRQALYDFCDQRIDTGDRTSDDVARLIIDELSLDKVPGSSGIRSLAVNASSKKYAVMIGQNILTRAIQRIPSCRRMLIVSNPLVCSLYLSKITPGLRKKCLVLNEFVVPDGERYKNHKTVLRIHEYLLRNSFERSDTIVALGGGVISDLCGFAASTFKRGMGFVIMPTTLLAQVDAAIGGKTGVDMMVKNSIGTFYQPDQVIIDVDYLKTLSHRHFLSGFAEVIKYGAIQDPALFLLLEKESRKIKQRDPKILQKIINRCVAIKSKIVARDERELNGQRLILNFGHTIGHVIERLKGYSIDHGAAVAMGMVEEAGIACKLGLLADRDRRRLMRLILDYGLPAGYSKKIKMGAVYKYLRHDKKIAGSKLRLPVLVGIGRVKTMEVKWEKLLLSMVQI